MTRYAISKEGAEAMESLSRRLGYGIDGVNEASLRTGKNIHDLGCEGLGIYFDEINDLIQKNIIAVANCRDLMLDLSYRVKKKSEWIWEMVQSGLGEIEGSPSIISLQSEKGFLPRCLSETRFGFNKCHEGYVYDSPEMTNNYLYQKQGMAYSNFLGTCGLCSCANILRLAGVNLSEKDMIDYATSVGLCRSGSFSGCNGGTNPENRQAILEHFGIESELESIDTEDCNHLNKIADYVKAGKGVILALNSDALWYGAENDGCPDHAVVVISVVTENSDGTGDILGFYICDTGSTCGGTKYYTADDFEKSLVSGADLLNVTKEIIR